MYTIDWRPLSTGARQARTAPIVVSRTVWCLGLTSLFTDISSEMISSVLPAYLVLHLGMSPLGFGAIDAVYQGGGSLFRLAAGALADVRGRYKSIAVLGYAMSAACRIGLLLAGNAATVIAALVGIDRSGKAIRTAPRDALLSMNSTRENLGLVFGVHRMLDAAGAFLGPLAAFAVLALLPRAYDALFVISFSAALIGLGIIALFVDDTVPGLNPASSSNLVEDPGFSRGVGAMFAVPQYRRMLIGASLLGLTSISDGFVYLMLQRSSQVGAAIFPLFALGTAATYMLIAIPAGRVADRWGRLRVFLLGHAPLLGVYVLLWSGAGGLVPIIICLALLGLYYASTDGVMAAATSAVAAHRTRGTGLAVMGTASSLARSAGGILFGAMWFAWGIPASLVTFAIALTVALAIATRLLGGLEETES